MKKEKLFKDGVLKFYIESSDDGVNVYPGNGCVNGDVFIAKEDLGEFIDMLKEFRDDNKA